MKVLYSIVALVFLIIPVWAHAQTETQLDMQAAFVRDVGKVATDEAYRDTLVRHTENLVRENQTRFDASQFFLLVDRNHRVQKAFLAFYSATEGKVVLLGTDNVSTGNPNRRGHFETPTGIFENKPANMSYRALGTKNEFGWRGLGRKGSRVWDLGWQRTVRRHGDPMDIRMLVHATDPDYGEQRLGTVQSMGCVRISARFNRFLDRYGVLDQEYEGNAKVKYVLLTGRTPVSFAGKFIIVVDSSAF